jgi:hypothetical protein
MHLSVPKPAADAQMPRRRSPAGIECNLRITTYEVTANAGDMKKATQMGRYFHWPRLSAESTG